MPILFYFACALLVAANVQAESTDVKTVVLDVRTQSEFDRGHVAGALLMDFTAVDFVEKVKALDRGKSYKVYCAVGGRSARAEKLMRSLGFKDVENLGGVKEAAKRLMAKCEGTSETC